MEKSEFLKNIFQTVAVISPALLIGGQLFFCKQR